MYKKKNSKQDDTKKTHEKQTQIKKSEAMYERAILSLKNNAGSVQSALVTGLLERAEAESCLSSRVYSAALAVFFTGERKGGGGYHCNALQHAATYCNTLQHAARRCKTLHMIWDLLKHAFGSISFIY